jgi:hypothetical protein
MKKIIEIRCYFTRNKLWIFILIAKILKTTVVCKIGISYCFRYEILIQFYLGCLLKSVPSFTYQFYVRRRRQLFKQEIEYFKLIQNASRIPNRLRDLNPVIYRWSKKILAVFNVKSLVHKFSWCLNWTIEDFKKVS